MNYFKNIFFCLSLYFCFFSNIVKSVEPIKQISPQTIEMINYDWVEKVKPIFVRACFDCHSDQSVFPWYHSIPGIAQFIDHDIKEARENIDFSGGFPFKGNLVQKGYVKMLKKINHEVKEGDMPTKPYQFMHSKSKLSQNDLMEISNWVIKSIKVLKN